MHTNIVQVIRNNSKPLTPLPAGVTPRLTVMEDLRAVVFDIYGTLFISESGDRSELDSEDFHLFSRVLDSSGAGPVSDEAAVRAASLFRHNIDTSHDMDKAAGIPYPEVEIRRIWHRVLDTLYDEKLVAHAGSEAAAEECAVYYEALSNPVYPMPGLEACIGSLLQRGLSLGIVSNAQFYTPALFEAFFGRPLHTFGFLPGLCIWSYRLGRAKPDRALYRHLAEGLSQLSITPEETLYIGNDMLKDIYPASEEGFRTGLFAGDRRSLRLREKELCSKNVKSDIIITELVQLLEVITVPGAD